MKKRRQVLLSFSGGKDSSLALHALLADEQYEVVGLLMSVRKDTEKISVHEIRKELMKRQLACLKAPLPVFEVVLLPTYKNTQYEEAFFTALNQAQQAFPQVECLAFGDLFLEDIRAYREKILASWEGHDGRPLQPLFPVWGKDTTELAQKFIALGFRAYLVCVDTTQLDASFAGRVFDASLLADLPVGVDPCGENGEFHTFVTDGPIFARPVEGKVGESKLGEGGRFAYCDLLPGWNA